MAKVLVTGGAGYLGSILCGQLLDHGHQVLVLDNLMYGEQNLAHLCYHDNFDFIGGDVRDEALMRKLLIDADVIIPLAALVGQKACLANPQLAREVNWQSIVLLNKLRSPRQLVIFPTTNSGYGTTIAGQVCTEDSPLQPISLYGETKCQAEKELLNSANTITLRLATVFGMSPRLRLDLLVNHFVYAALHERYLVIFEKDFVRNYLHIRDVADCLIFCLAQAAQMTGRPFNVGLDEANLSKQQLALKIKEHLPDFYIHYAEVGADIDQRNYVVSSKRLAQTGFVAQRSLDQGIKELIKGYRLFGRSRFTNN